MRGCCRTGPRLPPCASWVGDGSAVSTRGGGSQRGSPAPSFGPARALPGYPGPRNWKQVPDTGQHYVDVGTGDRVLFLHGAASWSYCWWGLLNTLAPDFRCIAPDLAGLGLSPGLRRPSALSTDLNGN